MYYNQGYGNYPYTGGFGYGCGCGCEQPTYQTGCYGGGAGYALILVLFILLVIIGASRF